MSEKIDQLAVAICQNLGLDPFEYVSCYTGDDLTAKEHDDQYGRGSYAVHDTQMPRWRLWRKEASKYLAVESAMRELTKP